MYGAPQPQLRDHPAQSTPRDPRDSSVHHSRCSPPRSRGATPLPHGGTRPRATRATPLPTPPGRRAPGAGRLCLAPARFPERLHPRRRRSRDLPLPLPRPSALQLVPRVALIQPSAPRLVRRAALIRPSAPWLVASSMQEQEPSRGALIPG